MTISLEKLASGVSHHLLQMLVNYWNFMWVLKLKWRDRILQLLIFQDSQKSSFPSSHQVPKTKAFIFKCTTALILQLLYHLLLLLWITTWIASVITLTSPAGVKGHSYPYFTALLHFTLPRLCISSVSIRRLVHILLWYLVSKFFWEAAEREKWLLSYLWCGWF